jgi:hypothetical protein
LVRSWGSVLFFILAIKFSFCPTYPRMVLYFSYANDKLETLASLRQLLESQGYVILEYAPEDGFLFTEYKEFNWGTGRRLMSLVVHVTDKITLTGMGKMDVPVSDLGNSHELQKIKEFDKLPYKVQKKTFLYLIEPIEKLGYKQILKRP